ncbi:peptidoglycan DD-metalloendopeptidase family protein [Alkalibaculum sp. M08DMB]|uniref:Peptidoglycan DD-metalloendopeptidase family protein n=1 Tax=Alkalibaculum sporogenes TaxID=2655001 RepID=A0A6A7K8E7_9FIRM|nr:M23 family metallopeptidase [Alkalibaculum sporogenes]MPW25704.1 peptidoglycan DD-metalloendopeptidase family protein [Alkalibaculum sporogenes]
MENTHLTNEENDQDLKGIKFLKQISPINKSNIVINFKLKLIKFIHILMNPKLAINEIAFRYDRFVGTVKHKFQIFYEFKLLKFKESSLNSCHNAMCIIAKYKKQCIVTSLLIIVLVLGVSIYDANIGYQVSFNGQDIGIVKEQKVFAQAVGRVNRELSSWYGNNIVFQQDIAFEKTFIRKDKLLSNIDESLKAVYDTNIDLALEGAVIIIEGEEIASFSSKEDAQRVIDGVLSPYVKENNKSKLIEDPVIHEDYTIEEKLVNYGSIKEVNQAIALISQGTEEINQYKVKSGDTSWDIAVNRGVNIKDIEDANPEKDITSLRDGELINLAVEKPYLTIETVKEEVKEEKINYETVYKKDSSIYIGKTKVISEGVQGIKQITSIVEYENNNQISAEIIDEKVIKEAQDKVIAKGTKALPPGQAKGSFRLPTSGRITAINKPGSHSGGRAVDIANRVGTNIYAADSGKVTLATNRGNGYGNYIVIDHGNGYSTLYAHLSSIRVSVGNRVSRGQNIGGMGSTGNSSGSHLHFEVIKNGSRQKITNYFNLSRGRTVSP